MKSFFRNLILTALKVVGVAVALMVLISAIAQIILSPRVCGRILDRLAPEFVEGKVEIQSASVAMFRNFPRMTAQLQGVVVTYPSERFDSVKRCGAQGILAFMGNGTQMDTLASFERLTASLNPFALLGGVLKIRALELEHPRVYVHYYCDGSTNLDIIRLDFGGDEEEVVEDGAQSDPLKLEVKRIHLGQRPFIVYSDQKDTLMAVLAMKEYGFDGRLITSELHKSSFKTDLDSLFVSGRIGRDTLLLAVPHVSAQCKGGSADIEAAITAFAATRAFGRISIPVALEGNMDLRTEADGSVGIKLNDMDLDVSSLCLQSDMDILLGRNIGLHGSVVIPGTKIQDVMDNYGRRLIPELAKVHTDAVLSARLDVDGYLDTDSMALPAFTAALSVPRSYIAHSDYKIRPTLQLATSARASQSGKVNVNLDQCCIQAPGLDLDLMGKVRDVLGNDPDIDMDASLELALDSFGPQVASLLGLGTTEGELEASAKARLKLSQMNVYNMADADVKADIRADKIRICSDDDSLSIYAGGVNLKSGLMENRFEKSAAAKKSRSLATSLKVDTLNMHYVDRGTVRGRDLSAFMQNSAKTIKVTDSTHYNPLLALLKFGSIFLEGQDSVRLSVKESKNMLSLRPGADQDKAPTVHVGSSTQRIRIAQGAHRVMFSNLDVNADASMRTHNRVRRGNAAWRNRERTLPEWLSEEDFRKSDIKLDLGENLMKYYNNWNLSGDIVLKSARMMTPAFPLRTRITDFHGSFDNDHVALDTLRVESGASNFAARGAISSLRRAVRGRGNYDMNLDIRTDSLVVGELLTAYLKGGLYMSQDLSHLSSASDEEIERTATQEMELAQTEASPLLVIPGNVNANIALRGKGLNYASLNMNDLSADLTIRERCLLLHDFRALTSAGSVFLDAFYSTRSKDKLYAGLDLDLKDVSAGQVIDLMPQLDTLMPLIKSFDGLLNCNVSAVTRLDTNMNVITSSANGVVRIAGKDLTVSGNKQVAKMARLLWVKNPDKVVVDTMTVEGVLKDNTMEIFPFVMKIDKWSVAMAGLQNLDQSFRYHVSVTKSPLGIRLGANIFGDNFSNFKFKLGKALYKDSNVPSFSKVIDTTRINLHGAIVNVLGRGVDRAIRETVDQDVLERARERAGYIQSAALETLQQVDASDRQKMDTLDVDRAVEGADSLANAATDSLIVAEVPLLAAPQPGEKPDSKGKAKEKKNKAAKASADVAVTDKDRKKTAADKL